MLTPDEMAEVDRAAPEPVDVLIGRAGGAVARAALALMGGAYGRTVVVLAGKGNNGNDGREAARRLRRRGARVAVIDVAGAPARFPAADLVIDAAFGTGFRGGFDAPLAPPGTPVLAVDIPSGVDGVTGAAGGRVLAATMTVTFAAAKPGLLFEPGRGLAGDLRVADIGLDVSAARTRLVEDADITGWVSRPAATTHKWRRAVWIVAGSPGMEGAAALACAGAQRAGAGYVRLSAPGLVPAGHPVEVVGAELPARGWAREIVRGADRFGALVLGNGLGRDSALVPEVREVVAHARVPVVVDADGLVALGHGANRVAGTATVLTPHDGEFERLVGRPPDGDRVGSVRAAAAETGAIVLLKGPTTVVGHPDGRALVVANGSARLATAGTGDVLAGVIGALCARGVEPFEAAAAGAFIHAAAANLGWSDGLVAGDVADLVPVVLEDLSGPADPT